MLILLISDMPDLIAGTVPTSPLNKESQQLELLVKRKEKAFKLVFLSYLYSFLNVECYWFVSRVICLFQMMQGHRATQFVHRRSLCLWIWRITTARTRSSSSPPPLHGRTKHQPCLPPKATAPSPTWTCSTWTIGANQTHQSTETPSSGPVGQWTTRRACAVRSSHSLWGTLPTWMKSKTLVLGFTTQEEYSVCTAPVSVNCVSNW